MHPFQAINLIFKNDFTRKMLSTHLFIAVIFIKEKREDNDGSKLIKDWNPIRPMNLSNTFIFIRMALAFSEKNRIFISTHFFRV